LSIVRASGSEDNGALSGVKWGAMGDSFTDPATLSGQPDTRNYVDLIAEQTGVDVINYGKSGGGYKAREAQNEAFYQVALAVASNLNVVTIFGSGNDQNWVTLEQIGTARDTGTETLCGCMNTAIDNLISVNPLVRIGLVTPTPWRNYPPDSTTATWMKIYSERIIEVAALRGIPCLDLYHDSNLRPWNADCLAALYIDNTHPNTEGHKRIASQIKAFLIEMAG
jgi:lysophospholipase L1-like esterase